jgi:hypothetical protein
MQPTDPVLDAVRRRRTSLRSSMNKVEVALAEPAAGRAIVWNGGVRAATLELQSCMREHVQATEGPDGFHREMLEAAPRLAHAIEVSVKEHVVITELVDDVLSLTGELTADDDVELIRERGTDLLARISRHRQRGADMIFEAYEADVGGQD